MERVKQAAQEMPRVVFVGDGDVPQELRDLFPGTEFVRPSDMNERTRTTTGSAPDRAQVQAVILAAILAALAGGASKPAPAPAPEPTPRPECGADKPEPAPAPAPEPTPRPECGADKPEPAHTRRSTDDPILDTIKPLAFAELDKLAAEYGLSFSDEEREALFALSKVFDPEVAKVAARAACAMFNEEEQQ